MYRSRTVSALLLAALLCLPFALAAQGVLMMPDSTNDRMVLFDAEDGSVLDEDYFALAGGQPIHALQVGEEIWVSEQSGDRVSRWSLTGEPLGQIGGGATGGLDNLRAMARVGNEVLLTNAGVQNTAPGNALVRVDLGGSILGNVVVGSTSPSPFAILALGERLLVASSSDNDDIHEYTLALASVGTFHNSGTLNFAQQMVIADNGDVLAAGFSSNNVVRLNSITGAGISSFAASGARGVAQLGNGNILWSNSAGAHVFDVTSSTSTQVYTGGGRHFGLLDGPADLIYANDFECADGLPGCDPEL